MRKSWSKIILQLATVSFFVIPILAAGENYSSSNFKVADPVIDSGAGLSVSASYKLQSSVGQLVAGSGLTASYRINSGFLYYVIPPVPTHKSCVSQTCATITGAGTDTCTVDANCVVTPPSGGGGGGGGGGGYWPPTPSEVQAIFRGKAYPRSVITILKDGQIFGTTLAGDDANFEIRASGLTAGSYNFGIWAEDSQYNRSLTQQFQVGVTTGFTTVVSGIFFAPTISVDKIEVQRGQPISIFGQSAPSSTISVLINSPRQLTKKTISDESGIWLYKFDTSEVDYGDHSTRATAAKDGDMTSFSKTAGFKVGTKTILASLTPKTIKTDISGDGRVNLVDFSILAYWYRRALTTPAAQKADLNADGKVDLKDFSIMAYYWTG
ncbi:MAG: hypothetical protein LiPW15_182 [Parcubacteria group bacterium LiPW_15]|nr:MAG: hypothetical protein LiPW15_182 [Parcubacteria group bacterium LiPW_15]